MTAIRVNVRLKDDDLPAAARSGGVRWLELYAAAGNVQAYVSTVTQARALHSAAQQIFREMREEEKAAARVRRDQVTAGQNGSSSVASSPAAEANGQLNGVASLAIGGPAKPVGPPDSGNSRRDLMIRLGNLGCPHDVRDLDLDELEAHGHEHAAEVGRAGQPPAELDNVGGRVHFAGYQTVPTYTCGDCGGHGTMPTHRPECWRYRIAQLRSHKTVGRARQSLLALQEADPGLGSSLALESVAADMRALLALIDAQAGAV